MANAAAQKKQSAPRNKPLTGRRIIVSRAKQQASALSAGLRALGARVAEIPFIEIRPPRSYKPLDAALREIHEYDWLILTSVNGVNALFARMQKLRMEPGFLAHLRVAAIGPATQNAIEKHGLAVSVVPRKYVAESVVASLRGKVEGRNVLLVRAKVARDVIPNELRRAGAAVTLVEAYETVPPKLSRSRLLAALKSPRRRPDLITFTSSSTARNFLNLIGPRVAYSGLLDGVSLASIGPITSATLRELNLPVSVQADEYTIPGLIDAILRHFS